MSRDFSQAFEAWIEGPDQDLEQVVAYHEGRLSEEQKQHFEQRLSREPELADLLQELRSLAEAESFDSAETASEFEVAATMRAIRRRPPAGDPTAGAPKSRGSSRLWAPLAASLLVACLGLAWGWQTASHDLAAVRAATATTGDVSAGGAQIHHLFGEAQVRGGTDGDIPLITTLEPTQVLVITLEDPPPSGTPLTWRLLRDGAPVAEPGVTAIDHQGLVILAFPATLLSAGNYTLELDRQGSNQPRVTRTFEVPADSKP